jgi:hypothetical protein
MLDESRHSITQTLSAHPVSTLKPERFHSYTFRSVTHDQKWPREAI